ncbi:MAG: alanine racemase [Clostridia bacterium]|nr:alanine racemase [Clostridia bacterium]
MTTQRVRVQIDTGTLLQNYRKIENAVPSGCKIMAVVKADAYGHGAVRVCRLLYGSGCDYFAVACLEEAVWLRQNGVQGSILILGTTDPVYAKQMCELDLIQTVDSESYGKELAAQVRPDGKKLKIHVKIDTGMSRLGIYCHRPEDVSPAADAVESVSKTEGIQICGIFTHFADSDGPEDLVTRAQFAAFRGLLDELERRRVDVGLRHCCNSAAILRYPDMHLDMVRAGLILYGLRPSPYCPDIGLKPAMKLIARISAVRRIRAGDTVSYGCAYKAERDMTIAVLSIGYADGLPRMLSDRLSVRINGKDAPLIGRICMDLCMADVTGIPCRTGDEAVVFDSAEKIEEIAEKLGTINYEVLCLLKKRVALEYTE